MRILVLVFLCLVALAAVVPHSVAAESSDAHLTFVGEWEGTSTLYRPRDTTGRENRVETITVTCDTTLKGTYVECNSTWTRADGRSRELTIFWNHDIEADQYEILFLYDDWPGKVNYKLDYDSTTRTFTGSDTFMAPGDIPAQERVQWRISEDGQTIYGTEWNHFQTDPEDFWPKTFEYVWRRK